MTLNSAKSAARWEHLGRRLQLARGRVSRAEIARRTGIAYTTIKEFEKGPWPSPDRTEPTPTMRQLAEHYGWTPDSIDAVLAGGEPEYATSQVTTLRDVYTAVASAASPDEQVEMVRGIMASNLPDELKAKLTKILLG